ncbi:unnamed protein product [Dibothriocephalus latus]|uniref:Uncharacterized protein n=1 Tax=Dibothriocephalus latus TaxID=60516 RepID=A0A3P7N2W7_DIBLA|nr:unnamed protein product [Dibothriocephalus latus]
MDTSVSTISFALRGVIVELALFSCIDCGDLDDSLGVSIVEYRITFIVVITGF